MMNFCFKKMMKKTFATLLLILCSALCFADLPPEIQKRQVLAINAKLENNEIEKAYEQSNVLLRSYENPFVFPANVTYITSQVYDRYLDFIEETKQFDKLNEVENNLKVFSGIMGARLQVKILKVKSAATEYKEVLIDEKVKVEAAKLAENESKKALPADKNYRTSSDVLTARAIEKQTEKTVDVLREVARTSEILRKENEERISEQNLVIEKIRNGLSVAFVVVAVLAFLILLALAVIFVASRRSKKQVLQLDNTLKLLAGLQKQNNQILLDRISGLDDVYSLKSAGSSTWGVDALPAPEMSDEEKSELTALAIDCEQLGEKIDEITCRKNNSKNVSELVYKLALQLGLNKNSAKLYFCAAMVYDAGFLALPAELWKSDELNEEQRNLLKTHVDKFEDYIGFVPKKWWNVFEEAARFHHENTDGSGYPEGRKNEDIPQIARLIHVAESFSSLVSLRNYRQIVDKESAASELLSKPDLYDQEVVKMLKSIV